MKTIPNATRPILIASCGIDCRLCSAYTRDRNPCPGCRIDNASKPTYCVTCPMKNCPTLVDGGFKYCHECDKFPCARVKHLDKRYRTKYGASPVANLVSIQEIGIRKFIQLENQKWTCPNCGEMLCMHKPQCLSCGYVWLTNEWPIS